MIHGRILPVLKPGVSRVDLSRMPVAAWVILALIAGTAVITLLYAFAAQIRNEIQVLETKARVNHLRIRYSEASKAAAAGRPGEVLIVDEAEPARKAA
jgi:hypothetical protein